MVDRYKVVVGNVTATAHGAAHPEGEYVLWRDYEALRARVAELEGDLNVTRLQLGARVCSECPARARVAELEARLKTPYCACSWDANDNVVGLCGAHAAKVETLRDAVLNDRGFLAEAGMTSDQTNAVLATIDALWPTLFSDGLPANKPAQQKGDV